MDELLLDIRRACRRLLRSLGFSLPAVATLAISLGTIAAVFALVNAVLLQPLPYPDANQLVAVEHSALGLNVAKTGISRGTFLHYRARSKVFEQAGVYTQHDAVTATDREDAERLQIAMVTPSVFGALRTKPARGRLFTQAEGERGATTVVVISHDLWMRRYGADPNIVGQRIGLNHMQFEVVGVLPAGFDFPRRDTQVWYNLSVDTVRAKVADFEMNGIARLKPGVTPERAQTELQALIPSLAGAYADATPDWMRKSQLKVQVSPLKDIMVGDVRRSLVVLACMAVFVLLIASANVSSLVLVRSERHKRDIAIERALGATDTSVARRILAENLTLTTLAGAVGLLLARLGVATKFGFASDQLPRLHELRLSLGTVVAVMFGSVLIGLLLSGIAYWRATSGQPTSMLRGSSARTTGSREWQRALRTLVGLQIALALTLLIGSALMVESLWKLNRAELGFRPPTAIAFELTLPYEPYPTYTADARFFTQLLERLRNAPGITAAEAVGTAPLTPIPAYTLESVTRAAVGVAAEDAPPIAHISFASPGYFQALTIPILSGRTFQAGDIAATSHPVVISAPLAQQLFGRDNPVGQRIRFAKYKRQQPFTIVGVVGGVSTDVVANGPTSTVYFPVLDDGVAGANADSTLLYLPGNLTVIVRSTLPASALIPTVRNTLRDLDTRVPLGRTRTVGQMVADSTARARLTTLMMFVAACAASFLGIVGIYGVITYSVSQRVPEFGVRLALGARPADVVRSVMVQGAAIAAAGVAAGLVAAVGLTRFIRSMLYAVSPGDPVTFAAAAALLLAVALVAAYVPARRAGRVNPISALKAD